MTTSQREVAKNFPTEASLETDTDFTRAHQPHKDAWRSSGAGVFTQQVLVICNNKTGGPEGLLGGSGQNTSTRSNLHGLAFNAKARDVSFQSFCEAGEKASYEVIRGKTTMDNPSDDATTVRDVKILLDQLQEHGPSAAHVHESLEDTLSVFLHGFINSPELAGFFGPDEHSPSRATYVPLTNSVIPFHGSKSSQQF